MEDFNSYAKHGGGKKEKNVYDMVAEIAGKFDGKNTNELLSAIYKEAKKGKENGTLTNGEIDNFVSVLSPLFNDKQRSYLKKIAEELKKI